MAEQEYSLQNICIILIYKSIDGRQSRKQQFYTTQRTVVRNLQN
jgi:hypothetical protein